MFALIFSSPRWARRLWCASACQHYRRERSLFGKNSYQGNRGAKDDDSLKADRADDPFQELCFHLRHFRAHRSNFGSQFGSQLRDFGFQFGSQLGDFRPDLRYFGPDLCDFVPNRR
jgi:hypothetical protein